MAKKRYKNNKANTPLAVQGPQAPITQADVDFHQNLEEVQYNIEPAEVVDIILNDTHPEYDPDIPDPEEQFGFIKVRRMFTDQNQEDEDTFVVPITGTDNPNRIEWPF